MRKTCAWAQRPCSVSRYARGLCTYICDWYPAYFLLSRKVFLSINLCLSSSMKLGPCEEHRTVTNTLSCARSRICQFGHRFWIIKTTRLTTLQDVLPSLCIEVSVRNTQYSKPSSKTQTQATPFSNLDLPRDLSKQVHQNLALRSQRDLAVHGDIPLSYSRAVLFWRNGHLTVPVTSCHNLFSA